MTYTIFFKQVKWHRNISHQLKKEKGSRSDCDCVYTQLHQAGSLYPEGSDNKEKPVKWFILQQIHGTYIM